MSFLTELAFMKCWTGGRPMENIIIIIIIIIIIYRNWVLTRWQ